MDAATTPDALPTRQAAEFLPVDAGQRIEALDVIRGFALLGIFLMNIEFFNRTIGSINQGLPRDATGADWWAGWFVAYFVAGKFWTIFSLLFGMGFAVMLVRAERAGRDFIKVYLRRILALAVIGAVHYIFIWEGDILFSYSVGALALLIVLYGRAKPILIGIGVLIGLGSIPEMDAFFQIATGLGVAGLIALHLRGTRRIQWRGHSWPVVSFILLVAGPLVAIAAVVMWLLPDAPLGPRLPLTLLGPLLFLAGWLSWKYHEPARLRVLRTAVGLYLFGAIAMTTGGLIQRFAPDPLQLGAPAATTVAPAAAPAPAPARHPRHRCRPGSPKRGPSARSSSRATAAATRRNGRSSPRAATRRPCSGAPRSSPRRQRAMPASRCC